MRVILHGFPWLVRSVSGRGVAEAQPVGSQSSMVAGLLALTRRALPLGVGHVHLVAASDAASDAALSRPCGTTGLGTASGTSAGPFAARFSGLARDAPGQR